MIGWARGAAPALALLASASAWAAPADDSPYCRKVRARASEEAALLVWPRALFEGLRFPSGDPGAFGPTVAGNFQVRLGVSFSPTDAYRGLQLSHAADADCASQGASVLLQEFVVGAVDDASLPALRAQAAYLGDRQPEWQQILARAADRREAGVVTVLELQQIRRLVGALERKLEVVRGEQRRIEARGRDAAAGDVTALADKYTEHALRLEEESNRLLSLEAFRVRLTGGVIPSSSRVDWNAYVEVSYSPGGLFQQRAAARDLDARRDELRGARYELPGRAAEVRVALLAEADRAKRELQVVERELSANGATLTALEKSGAPRSEYARATLEVEQLSLEADRIYLAALAESLATVAR